MATRSKAPSITADRPVEHLRRHGAKPRTRNSSFITCGASARSEFCSSLEREYSLWHRGVSVSGLEGNRLPRRVKKKYGHELTFLARYFDCWAINASFYGPLKPPSAQRCCDRVADVSPRYASTS